MALQGHDGYDDSIEMPFRVVGWVGPGNYGVQIPPQNKGQIFMRMGCCSVTYGEREASTMQKMHFGNSAFSQVTFDFLLFSCTVVAVVLSRLCISWSK